MPKIKIVQLVQSRINKPHIAELLPNEIGMLTGTMMGCCSVVVLWNEDKGEFQNVRGQHADADPANLAWDQLLANVPNDSGTTIIMICGKDDCSKYTETVKDQLKDKNYDKVKRKFYESSNALVKRNGTVEDFDSLQEGKYDIRDKGLVV